MNDIKIKARLFTVHDLEAGITITPNTDQAHYLLKVMRVQDSEQVVLFNGRDGEWLSAVRTISKKTCGLEIMEQLRPQIPEPDLWLAFAPLKKSNTDFLVEKATELGVSRLLPVFTENTNTTRVKSERLAAIATEAAEQCDRMSVPEISRVQNLTDLITGWPAGRTLLVPDETGGGQSLKSVLETSIEDRDKKNPHGFLIGPEGGFAASELDALDKLPFVSRVGLGPRILRAETAALAALSCFQAVAGDWQQAPRFNNGYFFNARK
ncbi:MAG: 16S rRNA (uracil(1498)-N(3))-methyltransferase [Rhodospirillales bacterium]|nr:16S rRNA (uracil(1498)-N(3))-methyltransferase [Rhodospirillales bacterium]